MTPRGGPKPARIFYGWWVALAFVVMVFLSTGIRFTVGPFLILAFGWRATCSILGLGTLVVTLPLSLFILRDSPEVIGLAPDGDTAGAGGAHGMSRERTSVGAALRAPAFWQLAGGMTTCGFSMSLIASHGVPMLTDHGFHAMTASTAVGLLGLTSIGGALAIGVLSDRVGRRPVLAALYLGRAAAFALLFVVGDALTLLLIAALGGLAMSGSIAITSSMTGDIFGRLSVGSIFGTIFLVHQTGSALGAWLGGALFDATGGYGAAFVTACTLLMVGAGLSLTLGVGGAGSPAPSPAAVPREPRPVAGGR
jgi:predicted MFS family arabinose efflux permease